MSRHDVVTDRHSQKPRLQQLRRLLFLHVVVLTNLVGGNPERFIPQIAEFYKRW